MKINEHEIRKMELRDEWWARLTADDRAYMITCAEQDLCPPRAVELLGRGSPIGAMSTRYQLPGEEMTEPKYSLPSSTREWLITKKIEEEQ